MILALDLPKLKDYLINFYRTVKRKAVDSMNVVQTPGYQHQIAVVDAFVKLTDGISGFYHQTISGKAEAMGVIKRIFLFLENIRREKAVALKSCPQARVLMVSEILSMEEIFFTAGGKMRSKYDPQLPNEVNDWLVKVDEARILEVVQRSNGGGNAIVPKNSAQKTPFEQKRAKVEELWPLLVGFEFPMQAATKEQKGARRNNGCLLCGTWKNNFIGTFGPHTMSDCPKNPGKMKGKAIDDLLSKNGQALSQLNLTASAAKDCLIVVA